MPGSAKPRLLILYGTETGSARSGIEELSKKWKAEGINVEAVLPGNDVVNREIADIKHKYDVLIVATSSSGEGDPPWNFSQSALVQYTKLELFALYSILKVLGHSFGFLFTWP